MAWTLTVTYTSLSSSHFPVLWRTSANLHDPTMLAFYNPDKQHHTDNASCEWEHQPAQPGPGPLYACMVLVTQWNQSSWINSQAALCKRGTLTLSSPTRFEPAKGGVLPIPEVPQSVFSSVLVQTTQLLCNGTNIFINYTILGTNITKLSFLENLQLLCLLLLSRTVNQVKGS